MPPPLRGSFESLARQNEKSEADGLERIENEDDLADRIAHKLLVPVPVSSALTINGSLPENHRYCRPWTASFLSDLARAHAAQFHRSLEVSSAVRTVEYQKRLLTTNGNAAAAEGDIVSPHLTGATIDIVKQGLSRQELAWMRAHLLTLQQAGKIDVEEEFQQACFHITVYRSYAAPQPAAAPAGPSTGGKRKLGQPARLSRPTCPPNPLRRDSKTQLSLPALKLQQNLIAPGRSFKGTIAAKAKTGLQQLSNCSNPKPERSSGSFTWKKPPCTGQARAE
jgi:hypothetical protein